ncbi:hypothetical protein LCGC14_0344600 [marine sediment metagenome]|uniref:Uncharacterized protein n=1 Tax=marine sediment metagenome TaxID=412755 RepID=A0A0F9TIC1_9ZZZZ
MKIVKRTYYKCDVCDEEIRSAWFRRIRTRRVLYYCRSYPINSLKVDLCDQCWDRVIETIQAFAMECPDGP